MPLVVRFEDGPATGQTRSYPYLSALPRLAWTGDSGHVQAVYRRTDDGPDAEGVWHYQRVENA